MKRIVNLTGHRPTGKYTENTLNIFIRNFLIIYSKILDYKIFVNQFKKSTTVGLHLVISLIDIASSMSIRCGM